MTSNHALSPRLIIADVDGTLLNSAHQLTTATRQALLALQRGGVPFTLATGKILPAVQKIVEGLALTQPLILSNGALIQQPDGTLLFEVPVPQDCLAALVATIQAEGLEYALYTPTAIYTPRRTHHTLLVCEYDDPLPVETDPLQVTGASFCKLMVLKRDDPSGLERMEGLLNARFGEVIKAKRSVPGMLEVFNAQTAKSVAVEKVAEYLGLNLAEVMVIGDSYNDLDMFRVAGTAVAMGNAPLEIKNQAHLTIGSNDQDGIATYLKEIFPWLD